jgi:hypothetical protein
MRPPPQFHSVAIVIMVYGKTASTTRRARTDTYNNIPRASSENNVAMEGVIAYAAAETKGSVLAGA